MRHDQKHDEPNDNRHQPPRPAQRLGLPASFTTDTDLPFAVQGAIRFDDQAVFHPRKFCIGVARLIEAAGGQIFEMTRAGVEHDPPSLTGPEGKVLARHIVQATQLPVYDPGGFFAKTAPSRSTSDSAAAASFNSRATSTP